VLTHLVVVGAALAATTTGFGFVVLSAPFLALLLPPHHVVPLTLALSWLLISALLVRPAVRQAVDRRLVARFAATGLLGVPIGTWLLPAMDPAVLRLALGLVSALFALAALAGLTLPAQRPPTVYLTGFVSGLLSGSVGLSGPPLAMYLAASGVSAPTFRATAAVVVWIFATVTLTVLALAHQLPPDLWRSVLSLAPALVIGAALGMRVFPALSPRRFRQAALGLAVGAGLFTAAAGALR
jgi:uncharacterized membrane protein YfcA